MAPNKINRLHGCFLGVTQPGRARLIWKGNFLAIFPMPGRLRPPLSSLRDYGDGFFASFVPAINYRAILCRPYGTWEEPPGSAGISDGKPQNMAPNKINRLHGCFLGGSQSSIVWYLRAVWIWRTEVGLMGGQTSGI